MPDETKTAIPAPELKPEDKNKEKTPATPQPATPAAPTEPKTDQPQEQRIVIEKRGVSAKINRFLKWLISLAIFIILIWIAMTIKNALDDTMAVEADPETAQKLCGSDACITIQGEYEDGFVEWDVRDYWPFFKISIGTNASFTDKQAVDIICPVKLKEESLQHMITKLFFLYDKDALKSCSLVGK